MYGKIKEHLQNELENIKEEGLFKKERIITTPQDAVIGLDSGKEVINGLFNK
jgi:glycine C-acetyltransferase